MEKRLQYNLTEGNVASQLIRYAIPLLLTSLFQSMYSLVDILVAGNFVAGKGQLRGTIIQIRGGVGVLQENRIALAAIRSNKVTVFYCILHLAVVQEIAVQIQQAMEGGSWIRRMFDAGIQLKKEFGEDAVCDFSLGNPDLPPPPAVRPLGSKAGNRRRP